MSNESKYSKNTFIGYLKMKKGGMKIIPGEIDDKIISKRNEIITHLKNVLSGGKNLKEKNIKVYFKALGGKYVRSDVLGVPKEKESALRNVDKLLKLSAKNNISLNNILDTFKGSAPSLYTELENKIKNDNTKLNVSSNNVDNSKGGFDIDYNDKLIEGRDYYNKINGGYEDYNYPPDHNRDHNRETYNGGYEIHNDDYYDISSKYRDYDDRVMYGGDDIELNNLRKDIGRTNVDIELNRLRDEILNIRNN